MDLDHNQKKFISRFNVLEGIITTNYTQKYKKTGNYRAYKFKELRGRLQQIAIMIEACKYKANGIPLIKDEVWQYYQILMPNATWESQQKQLSSLDV